MPETPMKEDTKVLGRRVIAIDHGSTSHLVALAAWIAAADTIPVKVGHAQDTADNCAA